MEFTHQVEFKKRKSADALVIPFWKDSKTGQPVLANSEKLAFSLDSVLNTRDFSAKDGDVLFYYSENLIEKRVILLGLGEKKQLTVECLRQSYGTLIKSCLQKKIKHLNLLLPQTDYLPLQEILNGIAEGIMLPNYSFDDYKTAKADAGRTILVEKVTIISAETNILKYVSSVLAVSKGIYYARNLVNGNADDVTPQHLVECSIQIQKKWPQIKSSHLNLKQIQKEKMGLLLAVNRGSASEPALIVMEYKGNPKSKDVTVFVGKGVTYDTGGLNIKPTGGMETMKCDMAGGAACFGTIIAAAELKLKVNLIVVVPTTENSVDANSFKPGDVYSSYAGKSVEMTNSDAEGRLILADALAYSCKKFKPSRIIDIATLTGAIEVALGSEASGLMSNNDVLAKQLIHAGEVTSERLWRMPLYKEYREKLKSDIADIKSWNGRSASSSVAAIFLQEFVEKDTPWAHLDIAGTAYLSESKKYLPKYATGVGIRLIIAFLEQLTSSKKETS